MQTASASSRTRDARSLTRDTASPDDPAVLEAMMRWRCNLGALRPGALAPGLRPSLGWLMAVLGLCTLASLRRFWNGTVWDDALLLGLTRQLLAHGQVLSAFTHSTLGQVLERTPDAADGGDLDLYRPLTVLSFALNYQLAGERPWLYHLTNLALHLGCVTWVYLLACELLAPERRVFAPLAAAWFGVTPHLAEAHVWISGRFDELGACFGLACCWLFLRALHAASPTRRSLLLGGAALSCLLSLLGKEAFAFALPALAFAPGLSSRGGRGGRTRRTWRMRALYLFPLAAALLVYAGLRGHALQGTGAATAVAREAVQTLLYWPLACWDGALSLLLPLHVYSRLLCEEYAALGAAVLAAAALGCGLLAALARRARRSLPVFAWSLVWFACTVLPVALIAARTWPGFGRFLYLPAAVFFVGMADLTAFVCQRWPRYAGLLRALLPLHVLFLAFGLYVYTGDFADDDRLFGSIIEQAPERSHGYGYLGMTYIERHDYARATLLLRKADALSPGNRRYLQALGQALLFGGHPDRALALADQAIARFASAPEFHLLAAYALLDTDQARAAREVAACLQTDAAHSQCREALRFLVTKHPAAAQFRERFAKLATQLGPKAAPLRAYLRSVL